MGWPGIFLLPPHMHTHTYTHVHTHMPHSHRVFFLRFNDDLPRYLKCLKCLYPSPPKPNEMYYELIYKGGWLLTSPHDEVEEISQNVPTTPEPEREETDPSARLLHNPVHEVKILGDDHVHFMSLLPKQPPTGGADSTWGQLINSHMKHAMQIIFTTKFA